jgi:hypothetical protein
MRALDLSGHYQRRVEIDTCPHCCLVWFDDTESVRLAGPGIADFLREIHGAMQAGGEHAHAVSLVRVQACPVCRSKLKPVANMTRFGRTTHLECPQGHGYYQTYILYLAEKGFVRPLAWADIRSLLAAGKEVFCASCGCPLPARPVDACPACRSAVGVIDPTRLASAIDPLGEGVLAAAPPAVPQAAPPEGALHGAAPAPAPGASPGAARQAATLPMLGQHKCHACGGTVDATRDFRCPHCQAPVLRHDTGAAMAAAVGAAAQAAGAVVDKASGRRRAMPAATRHPMDDFGHERRMRRLQSFEMRLAISLVIGALALGIMAWYRQPSQRADWTPQEAPLLSYAGRFREPAMDCDLQSAVRREVRVRQLIVHPGVPGPTLARATYGAMRAAHLRAIALRHEWKASGAFELLEDQYSNPFASVTSMPAGFFRRGEAIPAVERAAFCLPLNEISAPILAEDGFHLIEVVEAR